MNWKKAIRRLLFSLAILVVLLATIVAPIDYTPLEEQPFYHKMMTRLDSFKLRESVSDGPVRVGWSKFSIVPEESWPMAGYRPRANFLDVHDTLYARVMSFDNGSVTSYFITVDLLIFPPELKELILARIGRSDSQFLYFNASHTHTSVGGWDPSLLGNALMGAYQRNWLTSMADDVIKHMSLADASSMESKLYWWNADGSKHVSHRIDKTGGSHVDGTIRGLSVVREDSAKAMLFSYSVHPTLISRKGTSLSGDYPAEAISYLESEYDFVQFLAGMMGSHGIAGLDVYEFELTSTIGRSIGSIIEKAEEHEEPEWPALLFGTIEIDNGPSQLRLTKNIKLRDWVFKQVIGPLKEDIRVLRIGNTLFIGTSCDFSGEVYLSKQLGRYAKSKGLRLIITSFNGEYAGYITDDKHYETSAHEEVRGLNWVGPYFGTYYAQIITQLIDKSASY